MWCKKMLSNIRVLDFSRLLPGPLTSQMLADLGAEVIKVEEPGLGDYARNNFPAAIDGQSASFHALNRGKKSVALNIKNPKECETLHKLIATADVLIESFRPGVLTKYLLQNENKNKPAINGTDYMGQLKQLSNKYPRLIICCISGYGQSGPLAQRAGHDINYIARAGLVGLMKNATLSPTQIADIGGGAWPAVSQILASLYQREKTGNGNIIDVSMTDVSYAMGIMPQSTASYELMNRQKNKQNNENNKNNKNKKNENDYIISKGNYVLVGKCPCYEVYKCKDGFISVGALEPKFWKLFCLGVLKRKDFIVKQFDSGIEGEKTKKEIENILLTKTMDEWNVILKNVDCCVECVPLSENISNNDEQLRTRNLNVSIKIDGKGKKKGESEVFSVPKSPFNMLYGTQFQDKPAPQLGQHNQELLSKL